MKALSIFKIVAVAFVVYIAAVKLILHKTEVRPVFISAIHPNDILPITDSLVPPVIYKSVPDLEHLKIKDRKEAFINLLLPAVLLVKKNIEQERVWIEEILQLDQIPAEDTAFINAQMKIYKVNELTELPKHMVAPPVSIIIAQAAVESGWGTSRFFKEGNNIFGMWSYSKTQNRIQAKYMRGNRPIFVRKFDSIYQSILNYVHTIGRHKAYREFRSAINQGEDPMVMVNYLQRYSETGYAYTRTLKSVMRKNELTRYDNYRLLSDWNYDLPLD